MKIEVLPLGSLEANCYLISTADTLIVIDPGYHCSELYGAIANTGLTPSAVLLTHGHFDHICGAGELAHRFGVKVYIGESDKPCLFDPARSLAAFAGGYLQPNFCEDDIVTVADRNIIKIGDIEVKVISTPGHTVGGVCYLIDNALFCGDTVFKNSVGRTDFPTSSFEALMSSIRVISLLSDDILLYSGHGDATTVGEEKANNPYFM